MANEARPEVRVPSIVLQQSARPDCVLAASRRYNIPALIILSILKVESGGKVGVLNQNVDGSIDYGPAQINSRYWAKFMGEHYKISTWTLVNDICQAIFVQAYILRSEMNGCLRRGLKSIWCAVGRYHSRRLHLQEAYIKRVWMQSNVLISSGRF